LGELFLCDFIVIFHPKGEPARHREPLRRGGRADLAASAVLQRIRGGGATALGTAPCICGNLAS